MTTTADRIVETGMALFARQGYAATTVAQLERAAGLSPGAGGLYRHFRSKEAVLRAGVIARIEAPDRLPELFAAAASAPDRRAALRAIATAGIARLDAEHDLNRMLVRDLADVPDLLQRFRDAELGRLQRGLTGALAALAPGRDPAVLAATAAVLIAAVSHYWLLRDVFGGEHPSGVPVDDFLDAAAGLAAGVLTDGSVG